MSCSQKEKKKKAQKPIKVYLERLLWVSTVPVLDKEEVLLHLGVGLI